MSVEKCAQKTLVDILRYVDTKVFNLNGLARGLGRKKLDNLKAELEWLVRKGYLKKLPSGSLQLTQKGLRFGQNDDCEEDEFEGVAEKTQKSAGRNSSEDM